MRYFILLCFLYPKAYASNTISFKQDLVTSAHWLPYLIALVALSAALFSLAKLTKSKGAKSSKCKVVEQLVLNHKTKVYIVAYEQQQFIIADNHNGLALHALNESPINHEH